MVREGITEVGVLASRCEVGERVNCVHSWAFPVQGMVRAQNLRLGQRGPAVSEEH